MRRQDYVQVLDTSDEWEDLIGIVEALYDAQGVPCRSGSRVMTAEVRFPLSPTSQYATRLVGVNFFTDYVRNQLRLNNEVSIIPVKNLEVIDKDDL